MGFINDNSYTPRQSRGVYELSLPRGFINPIYPDQTEERGINICKLAVGFLTNGKFSIQSVWDFAPLV